MKFETGFAHDLGVSQKEVQNFYEASWTRKTALSDHQFYRWQFVCPPAHGNKDKCVVSISDTGIQGAMGLNMRSFLLTGETCNGAELTTWIVRDDAKGQGIGGNILEFIQREFDVLIGMGISSAALPIYMKSGFRYLKGIPRFIKVLNIERIKPHCEVDRLTSALISQRIDVYAGNIEVEEVSWGRGCPDPIEIGFACNHFSRTDGDLSWRYQKHPYFNYQSFRVQLSTVAGVHFAYIVLREEVLDQLRIMHVVDILGPAEAMPAALHFIEKYGRDRDFDLIDFYCTAASVNRFLLAHGWFSTLDDGLQFPHLFHPIELRIPPTTSLVYWARDRMELMCDMSDLYITKGDADLDRPTGQNIGEISR